jgi:methionine aminotransferase
MSQLAAEYNAINLSQGFPNFPVDERLNKLLLNWQRKCTSIHAYVWLCTIIIKIAKLIKTPTEEPFSLKRNY